MMILILSNDTYCSIEIQIDIFKSKIMSENHFLKCDENHYAKHCLIHDIRI
jgi:hypothetical protein